MLNEGLISGLTLGTVIVYAWCTGIYNSLFLSTGIRHSLDLLSLYIIGVIILLFTRPFWENSTDLASISLLAVVPIVTYSNSDLYCDDILKDNKGKAGIYMWSHTQSGKRYIGSSGDLKRRFYSYFSTTYLESCNGRSHIYNALLKYGYSNFSLEILEYCEPSKCLEREQYYIDLLKPEYNILKLAGSCLGNKARLGLKHSEETKKKMSEARLGRQIPDGAGRHSVQIEVMDLETVTKTVYSSIIVFMLQEP